MVETTETRKHVHEGEWCAACVRHGWYQGVGAVGQIEREDAATLRSTSRNNERLIDTHPAMSGLAELVQLELNNHNPGANWVCDCGDQIKGETFNRHVASMVDYRLTATDGDA